MTDTVTVSHADLDRLSDDAIELSENLTNLFLSARNTDQLALPGIGEDQAFDAFMEEREELKDRCSVLVDYVDYLKGALGTELQSAQVYQDGLRGEIERLNKVQAQSNAVLKHIADFATTLQGRLNSIGIYYQAGDDGTPVVSVEPTLLFSALSQVANDAPAPLDL